MQLAKLLAPQVTHNVRNRGSEYFAAGAVSQVEFVDGILYASVSGTEPYDVWLEPDGARLRASCTCPYFIDRLAICKHVWATIMAADAQQLRLVEPEDAAAGIDLEPVEFDDPSEDDSDVWPIAPPIRQVSTRAPRAPAPPAWQHLLTAIATSSTATPVAARPRLSAGSLVYVIDIAASITASALVLDLMTRDRKANGDWSKPRQARVTTGDVRTLPADDDRQILERLIGARPHVDHYAYSVLGDLSHCRLDGVLVPEMLPLLCTTGRCVARIVATAPATEPAAVPRVSRFNPQRWAPPEKPAPQTLLPLAWDDGAPWALAVTIRRDEAARAYVIDGALARGDVRMTLSEPLLVLDGGILVTRTHAARLDHRGAFGWLAALRQSGPMTVPFDARAALVDSMLAQAPPIVDPPHELRVVIEDGRPSPRLRLTPIRGRTDRLEADVSFDYDGLHMPAAALAPMIRTPDAARVIRRDMDAERRSLDTLHRLGFRKEWSFTAGEPALQIAAHLLPRVVRALLQQHWHVDANGLTYRRPASVALHVTSGIDWFELEGAVDYGDQRASLPALLAAAGRGDTFVTLGDGTLGLLPEEWLRKHGMLARLASPEGDRLRFRPSQVALLDALLAAQPEATCDALFARARRELLAFDGIAPADPPASFTGVLRGYQRDGLGWLRFLRRFGFGGCLADDMGLGKTVMVLALLAQIRAERNGGPARPSLVVAPRSLIFNWRQEAERFTPELRILEYTGGGRAAHRHRLADYDIALTTYGTLRRDAAHLAAIPFEYVVLDEAQAIKNAASASAKATRVLTAAHRLALSGTPIENHLGELWSLFEFLNPGLLGAASAFERASAGRTLDEEAVATLARGLRPFILRRTKAQVAPELPQKTEQTLHCELERPQRVLYDELRDHYRRALLGGTTTAGFGRAKLQVLEALLRLRQAACHPGLIDAKKRKDASAKLDVLLPHLAQAVEEGHKTLVFSQFTSLLAILRERLDADGLAYEYLDGRTRDRQAKVERFQTDPDCRLFLISLKAGGVGLNLTAAEYVFLLDPWWNPAVEAQAIDRAHRIGQSRRVFAYRLIAKDTVEERVLELQQQKRGLADAILTADASLIRDLKREDLELLLS